MTKRVRVRSGARREDYEVIIGSDTLARLGEIARHALTSPQARRVLIISNNKVFGLYGQRAVRSLRAQGFVVKHWLMNDGERFKTLRTLERALRFMTETGLERSDAVVSLGGGVVGDLAGFASAVYMRGLDFIQVPTTLLAQVDASVGGKVGVNTSAGKNLIGAFHHPRAVLIDTETLKTLPARELSAGWCEGVKHGAVGSRRLFDETYGFLRNLAKGKSGAPTQELERLIAAQVVFKASIVANDERESIKRGDPRSRRILNFGHTTAHALEAATGFRRFRHGEAVGYGMLVAGEISKRLGLLGGSELELLRDAVRLCGRLPPADDLDETLILSHVAHDKKAVGGQLNWVLLERLGRAQLVGEREIARTVLRASLRAGLRGNSENT